MIKGSKVVFSTPWFDVVAKETNLEDEPFYSLALPDYVVIIAITDGGEMLFVRQYRPAVETRTLELPSGTVDAGESAEETGLRELAEETGFAADELELLGTPFCDTGRLQNRMWVYLARDVRAVQGWKAERGLEVVRMTPEAAMEAIRSGELTLALHVAALHLYATR